MGTPVKFKQYSSKFPHYVSGLTLKTHRQFEKQMSILILATAHIIIAEKQKDTVRQDESKF